MMINVNYIIIVVFLKLINSYTEEVFNFPNNKKYVIKSIFENMPRISSLSRKGISFITFSKIVCAIHLIYKFYNFFDDWIFGSDEECDFQFSVNKKNKISNRYFRFHFNWISKRLFLINLFQYYIVINFSKFGKDIIVRNSKILFFNKIIIVSADAVYLSIQISKRGKHQFAFVEILNACHENAR
jgi:hypothetical protein